MRRRVFLKSSGVALTGAAFAPVLADVTGGAEQIGIGIIGTGVRGKQLMTFLRDMPRFRIAGYCDVLPFRLHEAADLVPAGRQYTDYRYMLEDDGIDAVVIATHFSAHFPIAMDALDAGKHVYCEKTMVKGIEETKSLVAKAVDRPGLVFQTGFQYHTSPLYRTAADMIARGLIGPVVFVDCQWNRNGDWRRHVPDPKWERQVNWRMYREYSSGLVAELSSHQMEFCNRILGHEVHRIQGVGGIDYWKDGRETYDNVHVLCRYASGVTASFTSLTANSLDAYRIAVRGKKGSIILTDRHGWLIPEDDLDVDEVDLLSGASVVADPGGAYRRYDAESAYVIDAPDDDPTLATLQEFGDSIVHGRQPSSDVFVGARISIMVQMAIDAMDDGTAVEWQPRHVRVPKTHAD